MLFYSAQSTLGFEASMPRASKLSAIDESLKPSGPEELYNVVRSGNVADLAGPAALHDDAVEVEVQPSVPRAHSLAQHSSLPYSRSVTPLSKPLLMRDRDHLRFVTTQPCLACGRSPSDAIISDFLNSGALGRKVSANLPSHLQVSSLRASPAVTNSQGNTSMSSRWTRRNGCGEQLIEAQKLKPKL
jgi:hypothetical protein